jgi:hypothetical protein
MSSTQRNDYFYGMKVLVVLTLVLSGIILSCQQKAELPCHGIVIREQIVSANSTDTSSLTNHTHMRIRCAANCPDGVACDSTIELTNTSMGVSVRRVKCGCAPEGIDHDKGIVIEHIRHTPDSIVTRVYCARGDSGLEESEGCLPREMRLPDEKIRFRGGGGDSLIVKRWEVICGCVDQ